MCQHFPGGAAEPDHPRFPPEGRCEAPGAHVAGQEPERQRDGHWSAQVSRCGLLVVYQKHHEGLESSRHQDVLLASTTSFWQLHLAGRAVALNRYKMKVNRKIQTCVFGSQHSTHESHQDALDQTLFTADTVTNIQVEVITLMKARLHLQHHNVTRRTKIVGCWVSSPESSDTDTLGWTPNDLLSFSRMLHFVASSVKVSNAADSYTGALFIRRFSVLLDVIDTNSCCTFHALPPSGSRLPSRKHGNKSSGEEGDEQ